MPVVTIKRMVYTDGRYNVKQTLSGTGRFTGVPFGYATYVYNTGGVKLNFRYRWAGTEGNAMKVWLAPRKTGLAVKTTYAQWDEPSKTLIVHLRCSVSAMLATGQEVADAVNDYVGGLYPGNQGFYDRQKPYPLNLPITVDVETGPAVVLSGGVGAAVAMTGGLDPNMVQDLGSPWFSGADLPGGLFHFEQTVPWVVRCVNGVTGGNPVTVSVGDVTPDLRVTNKRPFFSGTFLGGSWGTTGLAIPLGVRQAVVVEAANTGTVEVTAEPVSQFR